MSFPQRKAHGNQAENGWTAALSLHGEHITLGIGLQRRGGFAAAVVVIHSE